MKILFITHSSGMGGANHSMLQLIKELKFYYNVEVKVIVPILNKDELNKGILPY